MKKLLHTCFLLLLGQFLHGQGGIISLFPDSAARGTYIAVALTGGGVNFQSATAAPTVTMFRNGTPYSQMTSSSVIINSPTQLTAQFFVPPTAVPGLYTAYVDYPPYQTNAAPNIFTVIGPVPPPAQNISISGTVVRDDLPICTLGNNDVPIPFTPVRIGNYQTVLTNSAGHYQASVPQNAYTISTDPNLLIGSTSCNPGGHIFLTGTVPGGQYYNRNFLIKPGEYSIRNRYELLLNAGLATWTHYDIITPNSPTASGCEMVLNLNPSLIYRYAVPPPASISQNTYRWNIPPTNGGTFTVTVYDSIPQNHPTNTSIKSKAFINYGPLDSHQYNDTSRTTYIIVAPYDPNDKTALDPNGGLMDHFIPPGDSMIEYLIRFQNIGTGPAINIIVRDTVDSDFDLGTFRMESASHNYVVVLNGNVLEWTFPFINLVDSFTNEPLSHGWLKYSLRYPPTKPSGTAFHNSASIYFDYNAPVKTNTTETIICDLIMVGFSVDANGNTVNFTDNSYLGTTWLWDFGDGTTSTLQNPTHTYATPGNYTVCLTVTNACGRTETICQSDVLLNTKPGQQWNLSVFPNPTHDKIVIDGKVDQAGSIMVKDALGRDILPIQELSVGNIRKEISLGQLPAGVYFITISAVDQVQQYKIVKE